MKNYKVGDKRYITNVIDFRGKTALLPGRIITITKVEKDWEDNVRYWFKIKNNTGVINHSILESNSIRYGQGSNYSSITRKLKSIGATIFYSIKHLF